MSTLATVYRMYDVEGTLLYVGCAGIPPIRFQQHRWSSPWYWNVARIEMKHFESRSQAFDAEREAIRTESPFYNVKCKPPLGDGNDSPVETAA